MTKQTTQSFGTVLRAHGTRGELRLRLAAPLHQLAAWPVHGHFIHPSGERYVTRFTALRAVDATDVIAALYPVVSREALQRWQGAALHLPTDVIPRLETNEVYVFALLHKTAVLTDGRVLGYIDAVYDHGAGPIVSIAATPAALLVPLACVLVQAVDDVKEQVTLDIDAALLASLYA